MVFEEGDSNFLFQITPYSPFQAKTGVSGLSRSMLFGVEVAEVGVFSAGKFSWVRFTSSRNCMQNGRFCFFIFPPAVLVD